MKITRKMQINILRRGQATPTAAGRATLATKDGAHGWFPQRQGDGAADFF